MFLSVDAPAQTSQFRVVANAYVRDLAFDGSDFLLAFASLNAPQAIGAVRLSGADAVGAPTMLPLEEGESATDPVFVAGGGMPAVVGYLDVHPAYDERPRSALLFFGELPAWPGYAPAAPSVSAAARIDQNTLVVNWIPSPGAIGTSVELQLEDGSYRTIGVAGGGASSARVSLAGLQGGAVRLRAWNTVGLSEASASVSIATPRPRAARPH
jgi:hypothetical protein